MAYVFSDEDFDTLMQLTTKLAEIDTTKLSKLAQLAAHAALLMMLEKALKVEGIDIEQLKEVVTPRSKLHALMFESGEKFDSLLKSMVNEHGGITVAPANDVPWFFVDDMAPHAVGLIPTFLKAHDERPLKQQIDERYAHGGGWHPLADWRIHNQTWQLHYNHAGEGDPDYMPLGGASLNGEIIICYPDAWTVIMDASDGTFEVSRLDITSEGIK